MFEYKALLQSFKDQPAEEVGEEVRNLLQERDMDLDMLVRRLMEEGQEQQEVVEEDNEEPKARQLLIEVIDKNTAEESGDDDSDGGGGRTAKKRRVCFASSNDEKIIEPPFEEIENPDKSCPQLRCRCGEGDYCYGGDVNLNGMMDYTPP